LSVFAGSFDFSLEDVLFCFEDDDPWPPNVKFGKDFKGAGTWAGVGGIKVKVAPGFAVDYNRIMSIKSDRLNEQMRYVREEEVDSGLVMGQRLE
jgi:hypothetical protein